MKKLLLLSLFLLVAVGCLPRQTTLPLLTREESDVIEITSFEIDSIYGAHYIFDELYVEVNFNPTTGGSTKMVYNKLLHIDSKEGVRFATMSLPGGSSSPNTVSFSMWDENGIEVSLDENAMLQDYKKSGKVAFPQVTPGCDLMVQLEYNYTTVMPFYEHWFVSDIPVRKARFTLSAKDNLHYKEKIYGPQNSVVRDTKSEPISGSRNSIYNKEVWEVNNFSPLSKTKYESSPDLEIPRVSVALSSAMTGGGMYASATEYFFEDWDKICESYREDLLNKQRFTSSRMLTKKSAALTTGLDDDRAKAEAIFNWVRDSIRLVHSPRKLINPQKIMDERQGNMWDITYLLKEMLTQAGVMADVVVTRTRDNGGFDPLFITPAQLSVPIVTIPFLKEKMVAFPFYRGTALGEYPLPFFSLKGVSLSSAEVVTLPEPKSKTSKIRTETVVDLADETKPFNTEMVVDGYLAYSMRLALMDLTEEEQQESIQKLLSSYDSYNALVEGSIRDLDKFGEALTIIFSYANSENRIPRKGKQYMQLAPFFEDYLTSVSLDRKYPLYIAHGYTQQEVVVLKNSLGVTLGDSFREENIETPLFSLQTAVRNKSEALEIERITTIKAGSVMPNVLQEIGEKFKRLNSIKSESVVY